MVQRSRYGDGDDFAVVLQRAPLIAEPPSVSVSPLPPHQLAHPRVTDGFRDCLHVVANMETWEIWGGASWSLPGFVFLSFSSSSEVYTSDEISKVSALLCQKKEKRNRWLWLQRHSFFFIEGCNF